MGFVRFYERNSLFFSSNFADSENLFYKTFSKNVVEINTNK